MPFWELSVPASAETAEGLTNFLWEQGALGVLEEEAPDRPLRLRAFFGESTCAEAVLGAVGVYRAALDALDFAQPAAAAAMAPVADEAWATAWQAFFAPLPIGRFLVVPPWLAADARPEPGGARLVIEPARAFGTGHHGSTAGCLRLLERLGPSAAHVLDVGCGSGILAIAAAALGAEAVVAIDVDPDAVAATARNAELNACAGRVAARLGGPEAVGAETFPRVLANLLTPAHLGLADAYARLTAPGGALVLGGMLAGEEARVAAAVAASGFAPRDGLTIDGWAALTLTRSDR